MTFDISDSNKMLRWEDAEDAKSAIVTKNRDELEEDDSATLHVTRIAQAANERSSDGI